MSICLWNLLATSILMVTFVENGTLETEEFVSVNVMVQTPYNLCVCVCARQYSIIRIYNEDMALSAMYIKKSCG